LPGLERHTLGAGFARPPVEPSAPKNESDWREATESTTPRFRWPDTRQREQTLALGGAAPAAPARRLETPPFRPGAHAPAIKETPAPAAPDWSGDAVQATAPQPQTTDDTSAHERARRLARVLVSDILVYNQPVRDRALREGNLISALGTEVDKAWALYKAKIDRDVAAGTTYFKDALNEILADGQKVF